MGTLRDSRTTTDATAMAAARGVPWLPVILWLETNLYQVKVLPMVLGHFGATWFTLYVFSLCGYGCIAESKQVLVGRAYLWVGTGREGAGAAWRRVSHQVRKPCGVVGEQAWQRGTVGGASFRFRFVVSAAWAHPHPVFLKIDVRVLHPCARIAERPRDAAPFRNGQFLAHPRDG